jgi:predicted DNA-binding transcriptional regulator AlpA
MQRSKDELHDDIGMLRAREVARQLGISTWTLKRWCKENKFPAPIYLQVGSPATWRVRDIKAFLDKARRARRPKRGMRGGVLRQRVTNDA